MQKAFKAERTNVKDAVRDGDTSRRDEHILWEDVWTKEKPTNRFRAIGQQSVINIHKPYYRNVLVRFVAKHEISENVASWASEKHLFFRKV